MDIGNKSKHITIILSITISIVTSSCNTVFFRNKNIPTMRSLSTQYNTNRNYVPHTIQYRENGTKECEIDTISGYRKYWYENGQVQMEGKVTHDVIKSYRDSVWKYYSDSGLLMSIETYNAKGKVNTKKYLYFSNGNPLSETYEFFEGDPKLDKAHFKFHKIERLFYYKGGILSERHSINGKAVKVKCWNRYGVRKPLKYLNKVKAF
ncbi:MAG: hypothetical protein ACXVBK_14465 [Flavisolibacter sp.]